MICALHAGLRAQASISVIIIINSIYFVFDRSKGVVNPIIIFIFHLSSLGNLYTTFQRIRKFPKVFRFYVGAFPS